MPLEFGYLESSEKSEKKHKYYAYRAIIAEIYKARWQVLMEMWHFQNLNRELISRQKTSLGINMAYGQWILPCDVTVLSLSCC